MSAGKLFAELGPYARIGTAIAPFFAAMLLRLLFGKNRLTDWCTTISIMWFTANVLMAPYSLRMQQELRHLLR